MAGQAGFRKMMQAYVCRQTMPILSISNHELETTAVGSVKDGNNCTRTSKRAVPVLFEVRIVKVRIVNNCDTRLQCTPASIVLLLRLIVLKLAPLLGIRRGMFVTT